MPRHITIGLVDADQSLAVDRFRIPALDHLGDLLPGLSLACHAVREAADYRTGILVLGPKGAGKTIAIQRAVRVLEAEEHVLFDRMPETYRPRQFLYEHGLAPKTPRELLLFLLKQVSPGLRERQHGTRKSDDVLRGDLVAALLNKQYAVLIFDEAEYLADHAIDTLRKLMADAAAADTRRTTVTKDGEEYAAAGIGVVLVGTDKLSDAVRRSPDAGLRWSGCHQLPLLAPSDVAAVYPAIFPGFHEFISRVGDTVWREFIESNVARGRMMPIGVAAMHARRYFGLVSDASLGTKEEIRTREATPFVRETFLMALTMTEWPQEIAAQQRRGT